MRSLSEIAVALEAAGHVTRAGTRYAPGRDRPRGRSCVMRLCIAVAVAAAITPALADESLTCSTSFQGYRVCSSPRRLLLIVVVVGAML
jgi:hypothetical protein